MKKQNEHDSNEVMKTFQRLILFSILLTYAVILAGAIVRGTGSGLGCPDWPRCFGQWVPPTDISQLPANYKEIYKIAGKTIADFDAFKTWTEYINRLAGVVLGFFIVLLFGQSFRVKKIEPSLPWYCGGLLILILIQGGIGAIVVSTHLKPFIITIHMVLAVALLYGLLYLRKYCMDLVSKFVPNQADGKSIALTNWTLACGFLQLIMGTQVRQQVDHLIRDTQMATPLTVISQLDWLFLIHRSFSLVLLGLLLYLVIYLGRKSDRISQLLAMLILSTGLLTATSGVVLNYFNFPALAQPPHLFFAVLMLGLLYQLKLRLKGSVITN